MYLLHRDIMLGPMRSLEMWPHIIFDVVVEVAIVREELHIGRPDDCSRVRGSYSKK